MGATMRIALVIGGRSDYTGPAMRILPRARARIYPSEIDDEAEVEVELNILWDLKPGRLSLRFSRIHDKYLGPGSLLLGVGRS